MGEGLAQAGTSVRKNSDEQYDLTPTTRIGPMNEVPAALCFYRALRVYPSPVELIMSQSRRRLGNLVCSQLIPLSRCCCT